MDPQALIRDFLDERSREGRTPAGGWPFVTLSRQAGAGAHLLSYVLLTDLLKFKDSDLFRGWHVFDKELCDIVAQDPELRSSVEDLLTERYRSEVSDFLESLFTGQSRQYRLYKATFKVVRMLASLGKVIIVGRGACCVTRDIDPGIHVRLVAPESQRVIWFMKRFQLSREEARQTMRRQDADRRRLVKAFFSKDVEDPLLYDAVWNTSRVGPHQIASSICELIRDRAKRPGSECSSR